MWACRHSGDSGWQWPQLSCDHPHKACPAQGRFSNSLVPRINHGFLLTKGPSTASFVHCLRVTKGDKRKCRIVRSLGRLRTELTLLSTHSPLLLIGIWVVDAKDLGPMWLLRHWREKDAGVLVGGRWPCAVMWVDGKSWTGNSLSWANCLPRFADAVQGWTLLPRASSRGTLLCGQLDGSASVFLDFFDFPGAPARAISDRQ